jgi:hypothetical protein
LNRHQPHFDRNSLVSADLPDAAPHYFSVSPRQRPRRPRMATRLLRAAAAPIIGSSLTFPGHFNNSVERLLKNPGSVAIRPESAHWYFGSALRVEIDPACLRLRISDHVAGENGIHWVGSFFLDAADWSRALTPITHSPVHREMHDLILADLNYRKTRSYRVHMRLARRGRPVTRNGIALSGPEEVEAYYRYCVDLIASMRDQGVVPRHRLSLVDALGLKHRMARPVALNGSERDIGVAINADGELLRHLGGKHRTAVAQALALPKIPVEVRMVHVHWLENEMRRTGLPAHQTLVEALARLGHRRS